MVSNYEFYEALGTEVSYMSDSQIRPDMETHSQDPAALTLPWRATDALTLKSRSRYFNICNSIFGSIIF